MLFLGDDSVMVLAFKQIFFQVSYCFSGTSGFKTRLYLLIAYGILELPFPRWLNRPTQ